MCQHGHSHGRHETWITPATSRYLSSKMVQMHLGDTMPPHTTGPGREEVIIVLFGSVEINIGGEVKTFVSGETCFIPAETLHSVTCMDEGGAQYAYVVTNKLAANASRGFWASVRAWWADVNAVRQRFGHSHCNGGGNGGTSSPSPVASSLVSSARRWPFAPCTGSPEKTTLSRETISSNLHNSL